MSAKTVSGLDVWLQLESAGVKRYLKNWNMETKSVRGNAHLDVVKYLRAHQSFKEGVFHGLHPDVGDHRCDFRGHRNEFGVGSLQIVMDRKTGSLYADIDHFSPYEDVVSFIGHSGEVIGNFFRRRFRRQKENS